MNNALFKWHHSGVAEISTELIQKTCKRILLTGAFLSIGFITNFLSLNEIFLISLQGKPILGVNLKKWEHAFT